MPKFVIAFFGIYFGGLLATIAIDVSWGIYLYEINYFLNPISRWWYKYIPDLRYTYIISIVIFISYLMNIQRYSQNRIFGVPQTKWLIVNALLFAAISFWAVWPEVHNGTLVNHLKLLVFMYIAYKVIDNSQKFEKMIWAFLIGNFYLGWMGHNQGRSFGNRMENFGPSDCGGDGNSISLILISSIPILFYYLISGKVWQKIITLLFMAYILDAVILVNSRGAFVGLIVAMGYFLFYFLSNERTRIQKIVVVMAFFIGFGLFLYLTDTAYWERMLTIRTEVEDGGGGAGRTFFWMKSIELAREHPFGVGSWGYQFLSPQFIPEEHLTGGRRAVHSLYFQCLAERGYLGVVIFAGLLSSNFLFIRKLKKYFNHTGQYDLSLQIIAIESGFIAFLAGAVFLNRLHAEVLYLLMLFIACHGNIYYQKRERVTSA